MRLKHFAFVLICGAFIAYLTIQFIGFRSYVRKHMRETDLCRRLFNACLEGNRPEAQHMLKVRRGKCCLGEESTIVAAVVGKNPDIVRDVIAVGGDSREIEHGTGRPVLVSAAYVGAPTELIRVLLDHGARLDVRDGQGQTALMWAAERGNSEMVRYLIQRGADITLKDHQGLTAETIASEQARQYGPPEFNGYQQVIRLLHIEKPPFTNTHK
jgi:hypothetical protein